ncbi:MAG: PIG-L family deacetylase [Tissierellia bacterium]|nr:PIG-L family deacetylase [Tissierellia bacterium]
MSIKDCLAKVLYHPIRWYNLYQIKKIYHGSLELERISLCDLGRTLVVAPHVDDETIGMGALMGKINYDVLYMTDSGKGLKGSAEVRKQEGKNLHALLKCGKIYFLDGENMNLQKDESRLKKELEEILPQYDSIFTVSYIDNHPDHRQTTKIIADLMPKGKIYLYEVSNLLPFQLINTYYPMDEEDFLLKKQLYDCFPSQSTMDFSIFQDLNRGKGSMLDVAGAEFFRKISSERLKEEIKDFGDTIEERYPYRIGNQRNFYKTLRNERP